MNKRFLLFIFFNLLIGLPTLFAQNGIIKGIITDAQENSTLPGATILVEGTSIGTVTDIDGSYLLSGIPVGAQIIEISFLGFESKSVAVNIIAGEVSVIDAKLGTAAILGEEVIVTSQALGQAKAINQQLNSESIANIVSADRIQELPDVNAAEAIARLPGVAIQRSGGEGQKVVIRGMEPKFAAITVNGVRLPSNSPNDRSVDLSLISPEMLDGIEVFKSPLPDMDAESVGGTVNLRLRKAPKDFKFLAKMLGGYNQLNDYYGDYKGVLQASKRVLNDKLGIVAQASLERFNRSGDILSYGWQKGGTDAETGITTIRGSSLTLSDRDEKRKRLNASLNLDYDLGKHSLGLFGLYSSTDRNRFTMQNAYNPGSPGITYQGTGIEQKIDLYSLSLSGEHPFEKFLVDWSLSSSKSEGSTPYNFYMRFEDNSESYDSDLDPNGHPRTFLAAANPNLDDAFLGRNEFEQQNTLEETQTAIVNIKIPLKLTDKIGGYFKFGGKYFGVDRSRVVTKDSENFYYLGGEFTQIAQASYGEPLIYSQLNGSLISINNFLQNAPRVDFVNEDGTQANFDASLNPASIRNWYDLQKGNLSNNRDAINDNFEVAESITAGYAMLKLEFGKKLSVIPGFRYEYSDNEYSAGYSSVSGRYGVNGFYVDTTTVQQYGEFLPHLHIKFQPLSWFDIRASYASTLARPDYNYVTPRAQINNTSLDLRAGNPNIKHARSTSYDLFLSAYKGGLGLLTIGGFYKDVSNIFIPWNINLASPELATANGWDPDRYTGYTLSSYTNLPSSKVYGYEIDLQTSFSFLPKPLNGLVLNVNYSRLYSETEVFFLTSETKLVVPFPPLFETTYFSNTRVVAMPSQAPHIFHLSVGYDYKKFSARVSGVFQGTKAKTYTLNKDFDQFDLEFWRWDASIKQRFGNHWSVFVNINNFTDQQDISFTRNQNFINRIETFGRTGTVGIQYKL